MGVMPGTRPTGAALTAASVAGGPEVAAAAGSAKASRKSSAGRQRAQIDAIKSRRPAPAPAPEPASPAPASPGAGGPPSAFTDMRGAPSWYQAVAKPDPVALGNAGGGFLLGLFAWALGLAYLRDGGSGVKQLLAAKFLNKTA